LLRPAPSFGQAPCSNASVLGHGEPMIEETREASCTGTGPGNSGRFQGPPSRVRGADLDAPGVVRGRCGSGGRLRAGEPLGVTYRRPPNTTHTASTSARRIDPLGMSTGVSDDQLCGPGAADRTSITGARTARHPKSIASRTQAPRTAGRGSGGDCQRSDRRPAAGGPQASGRPPRPGWVAQGPGACRQKWVQGKRPWGRGQQKGRVGPGGKVGSPEQRVVGAGVWAAAGGCPGRRFGIGEGQPRTSLDARSPRPPQPRSLLETRTYARPTTPMLTSPRARPEKNTRLADDAAHLGGAAASGTFGTIR